VCFLWVILDELSQDAYYLPVCYSVWNAVGLGFIQNVESCAYAVVGPDGVPEAFTLLET